MPVPFKNRHSAGRELAQALAPLQGETDLLVLALPRGGLPVAREVADSLNAELDLLLVRKLGVPGHRELAMGAIASGGGRVLNDEIIRSLGISDDALAQVTEEETRELQRRERAFRGHRAPPRIRQRHVVLIDDGLATGATMRAAVGVLRQQQPARITLAVPVAPPDTIEQLRREVDEVVCLATPTPFLAIGRWYQDFTQLTDADVTRLLAQESTPA